MSGKIKGKQIVDNSLSINKISDGTKILSNSSVFGIDKDPINFIDDEYVTKSFVTDSNSKKISTDSAEIIHVIDNSNISSLLWSCLTDIKGSVNPNENKMVIFRFSDNNQNDTNIRVSGGINSLKILDEDGLEILPNSLDLTRYYIALLSLNYSGGGDYKLQGIKRSYTDSNFLTTEDW